jgi:hypothetical protein
VGRLIDKLEKREGVCQLYMDLSDFDPGVPKRGEYIRTLTKHPEKCSYYKILKSREVKRRDKTACRRFAMIVRRITYPEADKNYCWVLAWYTRRAKGRPLLGYAP